MKTMKTTGPDKTNVGDVVTIHVEVAAKDAKGGLYGYVGGQLVRLDR